MSGAGLMNEKNSGVCVETVHPIDANNALVSSKLFNFQFVSDLSIYYIKRALV